MRTEPTPLPKCTMYRPVPRFVVLIIATAAVLTACVPTREDELSESRANEIAASEESQRMLRLQEEFAERVDLALSKGLSREELRVAAITAAEKGDDAQLADLLFESRAEADRYASSIRDARLALFAKYPELQQQVDPSTCTLTSQGVEAFFKGFNERRTVQRAEVCGSKANQVRLLACTALCAGTTLGAAAGLCGWGCWCAFCTRESGVAKVICAD